MEEESISLQPSPNTTPAKISKLSEETGLKNPKLIDPYNAMLNLTDVSYGIKGHNKFYNIQVISSNEIFYLFCKWGRVGVSKPFTSLTPSSSKNEAFINFCAKFKSKTKNEWGAPFTAVEGKYQLVEVRNETAQIEQHVRIERIRRQLIDKAKDFPIECSDSVAELMNLIWDFNRMKKTMREFNIDPESCPLGQLSKSQIQKGYKILKLIQHVLTTHNRESEIIRLSNDFYTLVPQSFGMKRPPLINHLLRVREKLSLLDALNDLEIANTLSIRSLKLLETKNPADVYLSSLNCKITALDSESSSLFQQILTNTHGPTHNFSLHILQAYEVDRHKETGRFWPFKKLPNVQYLWHGSRITNFVGILSQGLRVAPKDAPVTGYMFGKGIYFADIPSKAANYCMASNDNPEGILMLCEVALGNIHTLSKAKSFKRPPIGSHSIMGVGKLKPSSQEAFQGSFIHTGAIEENTGLNSDLKYNEYIIYDIGQVRMRYLLRCRFEFSN